MHILYRMLGSALILCLVSLAQITPQIPDGTTIFTIRVEEKVGEEKVYNAAIKTHDGFIDSYDARELPPRVQLIVDEPWNDYPSMQVLKQKIKEVEAEPPAQRELRYRDSNFKLVETAAGSVWIAEQTLAQATRLAELQEKLEQEREAQKAPYLVAPSSGESSVDGPGFVSLWGRHVIIIVLAIVCIVLTIKICF